MSKKKKQKRRRPQTNKARRARRLPAPRVTMTGNAPKNPGDPADAGNPITDEIVRLHTEVQRGTRRDPFQIWSDWLETTAAWLKVVGAQGELGAMAELPADVRQKFNQLDHIYTRATAHHPPAFRRMGENFTLIHRLLADTYPAIDLEACGQMDQPNPDILGQAFLTSLGRPRRWRPFFPGWPACLRQARQLISDPAAAAGEVYEQLAQAHVRARLAGVDIEAPRAGQDETWLVWFEALAPYYEPLLIGPGVIFSSTMLLALASRFPTWITRNNLIRFVWPDIEADPMLNRITSITAMLYGFNGFYAGKQQGDRAAIARLEAHLQTAVARQAADPPALPTPDAVFRPPPLQDDETPPAANAPSFSELFKTT